MSQSIYSIFLVKSLVQNSIHKLTNMHVFSVLQYEYTLLNSLELLSFESLIPSCSLIFSSLAEFNEIL